MPWPAPAPQHRWSRGSQPVAWCFHPPNTCCLLKNVVTSTVNLNPPNLLKHSRSSSESSLFDLRGNFWMMKFWLDSKSRFYGHVFGRKMIFQDPKPLGWPWLSQKLMVTSSTKRSLLPFLTSHSWIKFEYFLGNRFVSPVNFMQIFETTSSKFQQNHGSLGGSKPSIPTCEKLPFFPSPLGPPSSPNSHVWPRALHVQVMNPNPGGEHMIAVRQVLWTAVCLCSGYYGTESTLLMLQKCSILATQLSLILEIPMMYGGATTLISEVSTVAPSLHHWGDFVIPYKINNKNSQTMAMCQLEGTDPNYSSIDIYVRIYDICIYKYISVAESKCFL